MVRIPRGYAVAFQEEGEVRLQMYDCCVGGEL
jgi:hypothetical protein